MNTSVRWINRYLDRPASPDEVSEALTQAGFPIEDTVAVDGGDTMLDVEITSNRGDCISHIGLAREVAACSGRKLVLPQWDEPATEGPVGESLTLINDQPDLCPLFTARVLRGVRVGPSPDWMVAVLEAVGQRSINNVVDVTNFITFEYGNPCHVFDLAKLTDATLRIRYAGHDKRLVSLDGKERLLSPSDLVVADGQKAQSIAGVIGGAPSEVTSETTDVAFEMATWDPVAVRTTSRRLGVRTDAGHRFERIVDARTIDEAARRAMALLVEVAGGTPCEGVLEEGQPLSETTYVNMRPQRCRDVLGISISDEESRVALESLDIGVEADRSFLRCSIPPWRPDLLREIDLIEEVSRVHGFDSIPINDRVDVVVQRPQEQERGAREMARVLTGLGFFETITYSFVTPGDADLFMPPGMKAIAVDEERRKADPTLRTSHIPSLLACRRSNQNAGVERPGGVRLYEIGSVYAQTSAGEAHENRVLTLMMDVPEVPRGKVATSEQLQQGVRAVRGVVETLAVAMGGPEHGVVIETMAQSPYVAVRSDALAVCRLGESIIGFVGLLTDDVLRRHDLEVPVAVASIGVDELLGMYPPMAQAYELPAFPGIDRDLSVIVDESTPWSDVAAVVDGASLDRLVGFSFVGTWRGRQIGSGRKSVTMRLSFRDPGRTLRHEEVDPQVESLVGRMEKQLGAALRA